MVEHKTVHPEGGYAVAACHANQTYIATAGRPNNALKITNIKTKLTLLTTNLKVTKSSVPYHMQKLARNDNLFSLFLCNCFFA